MMIKRYFIPIFHDGDPDLNHESIIKYFNNPEDFIEWLSKQNDDSLSGKESNNEWYTNNQRITKNRLTILIENFLKSNKN